MFFVLLYLFVNSGIVLAAGPYTHVYLTQKWIDKNRPEYNLAQNIALKRSCLLGGLWPDIRYLYMQRGKDGGVNRNQTHEFGLSVADLKMCTDPCCLGKKIHAFVDEQRDKFVDKDNIREKLFKKCKKLPKQFSDRFLKFLEDEVLYAMQEKWDNFTWARDFIDQQETILEIPEADVKEWHERLIFIFSDRPIKILEKVKSSTYFDTSSEVLQIWHDLMPDLSQDPEIINYVKRMLCFFEELF